MAPINLLKFPTSSPADTTPLRQLISAGYDASQILAVIGKTEGNGCVNDFSRTLAQTVWEPLIPKDAITIFSGGTEGVLSPHVTFIVRSETPTGLVGAVGHTRDLEPFEIGTKDHAETVAETVTAMTESLGVKTEDVQLVLIKCPLLTSTKIQAIRSAGEEPLTTDTYESMALSRYASALGIANAMGELPESEMTSALQSGNRWSAKASCSSGAELKDNHIFILAQDPSATAGSGQLRAISRPMSDAIDAAAIQDLLAQVKKDCGRVVQVFAKAEASPDGLLRGSRHTMDTDSDLQSTRHARAAVGGLLAGLTGDPQIYVSGGAEGQGQPGGGSLCVVYRCRP